MSTIKLIKTQTKTQKLFNEFLDGKTLPPICCERIMAELVDEGRIPNYFATVERVKRKLSMSAVGKEENVLFINFPFLHADEERPVLIRLLNMKYGNSCFMVVNLKEVVYVPAGSKNTNSGNELEQWLSEVTGKHLVRIKVSERKLKMKQYVDSVKNFFHLSSKTA